MASESLSGHKTTTHTLNIDFFAFTITIYQKQHSITQTFCCISTSSHRTRSIYFRLFFDDATKTKLNGSCSKERCAYATKLLTTTMLLLIYSISKCKEIEIPTIGCCFMAAQRFARHGVIVENGSFSINFQSFSIVFNDRFKFHSQSLCTQLGLLRERQFSSTYVLTWNFQRCRAK